MFPCGRSHYRSSRSCHLSSALIASTTNFSLLLVNPLKVFRPLPLSFGVWLEAFAFVLFEWDTFFA